MLALHKAGHPCQDPSQQQARPETSVVCGKGKSVYYHMWMYDCMGMVRSWPEPEIEHLWKGGGSHGSTNEGSSLRPPLPNLI